MIRRSKGWPSLLLFSLLGKNSFFSFGKKSRSINEAPTEKWMQRKKLTNKSWEQHCKTGQERNAKTVFKWRGSLVGAEETRISQALTLHSSGFRKQVSCVKMHRRKYLRTFLVLHGKNGNIMSRHRPFCPALISMRRWIMNETRLRGHSQMRTPYPPWRSSCSDFSCLCLNAVEAF